MERRILLATVLTIITVTAFQFLTGQCSPRPSGVEVPELKGLRQAEAASKLAELHLELAPEYGLTTDAAAVDRVLSQTPAAGARVAESSKVTVVLGLAPGSPSPGPVAPGAAPGAPPPPSPAPAVEEGPQAQLKSETFAERSNGKLRVEFTSLGGGVSTLWMKDAFDAGHKDPLAVIVRSDPRFPAGGIDDTELKPSEAPGGGERKDQPVGPLLRQNWTRDEAEEARTPEQDVVYTFTTADGRVFQKQWIVPEGDRYDLRLRLSVRAADGAPAGVEEVKLLASAGLVPEEPHGAQFGPPTEAFHSLGSADEVSTGNANGFALLDVVKGDELRAVGTRNQYYCFGVYAAPGLPALPAVRLWATGTAKDAQAAMAARLAEWYEAHTGRTAGAGTDRALQQRLQRATDHSLYAWVGLKLARGPEAKPVELAFYAGPMSREVLRSDAYRPLSGVITYPGGPDWVADALLWIYDVWRSLFGSVGLAVLLMTLTVRGLLMPLSIRNQLGMRRYGRKVQKLKPKVKQLQERFASNPAKLREQTMLLYREHGVGFPTGCLMMFVQIPIFFALFASLRMEYTLRSAPFLWIRDLSFPDRVLDLPASFPVISSLNLLPLLLVALSVVQARSMPKPTDEQQAQQMRMMKWMPILFAVILYGYTAALALYMVVSSTLAIIESRIVRRKDAEESGVAPA